MAEPDPTAALAQALRRLAGGGSLTVDESRAAVAVLLRGDAPEAATGGLLTALHLKGESPDELRGAVEAIRAGMIAFDPGRHVGACLDTCGTGGDGADTVNVSTAVAIVVACCGVPVVKHGNRSASSRSGSSDVLTRLGVAVEAETSVLHRCLDELGIAFLFAPRFHPGLRPLAPIRRQLPFRTLFNLVGPLCNPASPPYQLVGVPRDDHAGQVAQVLAGFPWLRRGVVVTGEDGLDEVTLDGPTTARVVEGGSIRQETWTAADFGLPRVRASELKVDGPEESARRISRAFAGEPGPVRSIVLANAAAALWTVAPGPLEEAVARAAGALDSGAAARLVGRWAERAGSGP